MLNILLSHVKLAQDDLKVRTDLHIFKLDGNVDYKELQPMVTELIPLANAYSVSLIHLALGGKDRTEAKNVSKEALCNFLTKMYKTIEFKGNQLPTEEAARKYILGTGCEIYDRAPTKRKDKVTYDYLEAPVLKVVNNSRHGVLDCSWTEVPGAKMYLLFEVDKDGHLTKRGHTKKTEIQLTGVEQVRKTYRLLAIDDDMLESEYSASVSVNVD